MINDGDIVVGYYYKHMYEEPCMISQQNGEDWMNEVMNGNSIHCVNPYRMHPYIFKKLCRELQSNYGLQSSDKMFALEKLGVFVYTLALGLSKSGETISRAFHDVLEVITTKVGWEGLAHDTSMFLHAINTQAMNFPKPPEGDYTDEEDMIFTTIKQYPNYIPPDELHDVRGNETNTENIS
nr:protein ALP1-like isoform X2 [Tanacetum cinerariifolium]